jgi:LysM repeat protein
MTINAEHSRNYDLVNRYAARIRSRHSGVVMPVRNSRRSHGIQTFGRRPYTYKHRGSARSKRALTTLMATAIMATSASAATAASSPSYEVQQGDTLTWIAENHGLTVDELLQLNSIDNPDQILVGAELQVSSQSNPQIAETEDSDIQVGDTVYEVRSGDTLLGIASSHGVSLADLLAINEIDNEDVVYAGDFLVIPTGSQGDAIATQEPGIEPRQDEVSAVEEQVFGKDLVEDQAQFDIVSLHLVARGETPDGIAQRYGITVEQLMQANGLTDVAAVPAGDLLRIPDPSWGQPIPAPATTDEVQVSSETPPVEVSAEQQEPSTSTVNEHPISSESSIEGMAVQQQALPLSSSTAAISMATAYWGHQVSEWVFIENMPYHQNPHRGFRGDMEGQPGGIGDYGVYPKPLSAMLANYGFIGDEFYTMGDPQELKERIDRGQPVLVWMTSNAAPQNRFYEWHQGERYALVPQQHVVVAYGYDEDSLHVADPASGQYLTYSWNEFISSWSTFDGMSMAIYPKG